MAVLELGKSFFFVKIITESDMVLLAGICGDFNAIHVYEIEADKCVFGKRNVHLILVSRLISTVIGTRLPGERTI